MKKITALLLALLMTVALFAACGETKEPAKDPVDPGTSTGDPGTPTEDPGKDPAVSEPTGPKVEKVTGVFDMTDDYTMVIEKTGVAGDDRTGVRCEAGKIEVGVYTQSGSLRIKNFSFDFASLGLSGYAWEYLGATVELEVTDGVAKIVNTPVKSTYAISYAALKFVDDTTIDLGDGKTVSTTGISYGWLRKNHLINEGGMYIPKWGDKATVTNKSSALFKDTVSGIYMICVIPLYSQNLILSCADLPQGFVDPTAPVRPTDPNAPVVNMFVIGDAFMIGMQNSLISLAGESGTNLNIAGSTYSNRASGTSNFNLYEMFNWATADDPDSAAAGVKETSGTAKKMLAALQDTEHKIDIVVIQGSRDYGLNKNFFRWKNILTAAKEVKKLFVEHNPNVKFYVVAAPGFADGYASYATVAKGLPFTNCAEHTAAALAYAKEMAALIDAEVINVGAAYTAFGDTSKLYETEFLRHPSLDGDYLIACSIFNSVFGKTPVGSTARPFGTTFELAPLQNAALASTTK